CLSAAMLSLRASTDTLAMLRWNHAKFCGLKVWLERDARDSACATRLRNFFFSSASLRDIFREARSLFMLIRDFTRSFSRLSWKIDIAVVFPHTVEVSRIPLSSGSSRAKAKQSRVSSSHSSSDRPSDRKVPVFRVIHFHSLFRRQAKRRTSPWRVPSD